MDRFPTIRRIGLLLLVAGSLTLGHVVLATLNARGGSWHERYLSLWTWDGGWYADIIEHGYRTVSPKNAGPQYNVAFFPGYPVLAGLVGRLLHLSAGAALLVTAQLSTCAFWLGILLLLNRWKLPATVITAVIVLIFCQPGSYYFVVSYAEPLFFACFVFFILLGPDVNKSGLILMGACVAGYLMSATRILGAPLASLPVFWAYNDFAAVRRQLTLRPLVALFSKHSLLATFTAFGTLTFFIYCAVRFGHWDEYMRAGQAGWSGNHSDYRAIFWVDFLRLRIPRFDEGFLSTTDITKLYIPVFLVLLPGTLAFDAWLCLRRRLSGFSVRAPIYAAAFFMFFVCASSGVNSSNLHAARGFIRYGLYAFIPLILTVAHAYGSSPWRRRELPLPGQLGVFVLGALGLALQLQLCWRYARAIFIA